MAGTARATHSALERDQQHRHRVERPAQRCGERVACRPSPCSATSSGRIVGVDRLGDDPVRRQEEEPADLVGDDTSLDRSPGDDRGAVQERGERRAARWPIPRAAAARRAPRGSVGTAEPAGNPSATPRWSERRRRRRHRACRRARAGPSRWWSGPGPGSGPATTRKATRNPTMTTVLPMGAMAGTTKLPACVQHRGGDRTEAVQHDLGDEEPQQEGRQLAAAGGDRRDRRPRR